MARHEVVCIPGLGEENTKPLECALGRWRKYGLEPHVFALNWRDGEDFAPKLARLLELIDQLATSGNKVSVIGTSAGGSAAINAFARRKDMVHKVVNVCGRLRVGPTTGPRSFARMTATSPAFAQSVEKCEAVQRELTKPDRQRVMTFHSFWFDELVPSETTTLEGAINKEVYLPEHMLSIGVTLTLSSYILAGFLKK